MQKHCRRKGTKRQLTSQEFGKYYLAVISGIPEPQEGFLKTISSKIPVTKQFRSLYENDSGSKTCQTSLQKIEKYGAPGNEKFTIPNRLTRKNTRPKPQAAAIAK